MRPDGKRYWFPAKRYGWGWGPPATWEGWLVLVGYVSVVIGCAFLAPPDRHPFLFFSVTFAVTAGFVLIAWLKGEPPKWRWGGKDLP